MTAAPDPGRWYGRLVQYKSTTVADWVYLAALTAAFLGQHQRCLSDLLGGEATVVTVVPSKRGRSFDKQPLRVALDRVAYIRDRIRRLIAHVPGAEVPRQKYVPDAFRPVGELGGERVLLIEDTWTTGATAVSAAGSILAAGAESVIVLPLARKINLGFWGEDHPYIIAMNRPWKLEEWPR